MGRINRKTRAAVLKKRQRESENKSKEESAKKSERGMKKGKKIYYKLADRRVENERRGK